MTLKPQLYGLIGFPIKHSLSPKMHNAAFSRLKINAKYKLFEIKPGEFQNFLESLQENNIQGFNVTYPYKEKILPYLAAKSFGVREIGAANTVLVDKGKLKGFNTDYLGFSRHLKELKVKPDRVALIGAGGAAKAVSFALAKVNVSEICVYDIDRDKSLSLINHFKDIFKKTKFSAVSEIEGLNLISKNLLVNASPVGMGKDDPCLVDEKRLHKGLFVYDLIYSPMETILLKKAKKLDIPFSNGLGMLLYQGVLAFSHFTGKNPPVEIMRKELLKGVGKND